MIILLIIKVFKRKKNLISKYIIYIKSNLDIIYIYPFDLYSLALEQKQEL